MVLTHSIHFIRAASKIALAVTKSKILGVNVDGVAQRYIIDALSSIGAGLPAKAAQILSAKNTFGKCELNELLMNEDEISFVLQNSPKLWNDLSVFSFEGIPGSLGEVHKGVLKNGSEVAIKIQYPGIESKIQSQLLSLLSAAGIVAKLNSQKFNYNEYLEYFSKNLKVETDYIQEAENQYFFYEKLKSYSNILIPKVHQYYSSSDILVQDWLEYLNIEQINVFSMEQKKSLANDLFEIFLIQFFKLKKIHGDFHIGNIGFTRDFPNKIVLIDFGAILNLNPAYVKVLSETVYTMRRRNKFDALDVFQKLGFNKNFLYPIYKDLPAILEIFLRPFCTLKPFVPSNWNFQKESSSLLNKHKMLFRMAGPPWFLMLMRTFTGLTSCFKLLSDEINTYDLVERYLQEYIEENPISTVKTISQDPIQISDRARFLCVRLLENGQEKVFLEMPARSCENLEDIIPDNVKNNLIELGYNIYEMKEKIISSNFIPQLILDVKIDERIIRVWLE